MDRTESISVLESLLETVENGQKGFAEAAEKLEQDGEPTLASDMRDLSQERLRMSNELKNLVALEGAPFDENGPKGTVPGAVHRSYMALRDALTGNDPYAVLAAAEQGEDHAVKEYEKALGEDLAPPVRAVVERQFGDVKAAHDRVRGLRDSNQN